ncbi:MAG: type I-E CRISPR-associated protein Cas7/Cse4/CasC [Ardenticatenaceae bacterium]|nr:type I-E CRISPR-associated protein Cas7/Cse4/CasC [Ardenticatenaceae bacterium]
MHIELHLIQNFAPSCLNRDDTNTPKDCEFGGVRRARISSQSFKRAIRTNPLFAKTTGRQTGVRTKRLFKRLDEALKENRPENERKLVLPFFLQAYAGKLENDGRTKVLLYLGEDEIERIAALLDSSWEAVVAEVAQAEQELEKGTRGKKKGSDSAVATVAEQVKKEAREGVTVADIALFGRMLADNKLLNVDAACQVAHAISTHRVSMEMDFFTAVDDLQPDEVSGAEMLGFTGFNSSCFYRYARLDWEQLVKNLRGDHELARSAVEAFLRAAVAAVPSARQNSMAAHNPPSFLLAVVRSEGGGWSLANAFERPVSAWRDRGFVAPSVEALDAYWGRLTDVYGIQGVKQIVAMALDEGLNLQHLHTKLAPNFDTWLATVMAEVPSQSEGV